MGLIKVYRDGRRSMLFLLEWGNLTARREGLKADAESCPWLLGHFSQMES